MNIIRAGDCNQLGYVAPPRTVPAACGVLVSPNPIRSLSRSAGGPTAAPKEDRSDDRPTPRTAARSRGERLPPAVPLVHASTVARTRGLWHRANAPIAPRAQALARTHPRTALDRGGAAASRRQRWFRRVFARAVRAAALGRRRVAAAVGRHAVRMRVGLAVRGLLPAASHRRGVGVAGLGLVAVPV
jgi:hypothetical protein